MARRPRVVDETIRDNDLMKLFGQMTGTEDPDPAIVIPKYERIFKNCRSILTMLQGFCESPVGKVFGGEYATGFTAIRGYVTTAAADLTQYELQINDRTYSAQELAAINADPSKLAQLMSGMNFTHKVENLGPRYRSLKTCAACQTAVVIARNMKMALSLEKQRRRQEAHDLANPNAMSDGFIINSDSEILELFPFSKLNFKSLMLHERMNPELKKYLLTMLQTLFSRCMAIVEDTTSPDMDVEKFSQLMVNSIGELKKHIPRCDQAFAKIQESVELMRTNFTRYYRDFVSSQNPTIIAEHFLSDVARSTDADAKTAFQFRQIAGFYAKHVQNSGIKDPRMKKMLSLLSANLDVLESNDGSSARQREQTPVEGTAEKPAASGSQVSSAAAGSEPANAVSSAAIPAAAMISVAPATPEVLKPKVSKKGAAKRR